ncbi:TonB-dependent receptor [Sphingomonas cavernae]|uniref:TonB-dependent receptor n=1 Tax=Sphingomonas cavernae TaxID=2320861 RepID=A0A418W767_9SPHN|nr:TonB-dependent receptor [Sphingomonas cavernae]RJF85893.1 TonB-dependent receptor [Sphingomonas cavernae]
MKISKSLMLASAGLVSLTSPAVAQGLVETQGTEAGNAELTGDIVVTARRREESLQDVPQTVNVVTADQIDKLNIRNFRDIQAVVPGLTLSGTGSFSTSATVRGVAFNPEASGNNATVEFYLNDAPISSNFLFQSMFDVGQLELLRGPQGTLRGRASPSGSITVTTRRPDLGEVGMVANLTATDSDAYKGDFALNLPIIRDMLGVRIAGVYDDNDGNRVHSIKEDGQFSRAPFRETKAIRATARFEPTDWLSANFMYQTLEQQNLQYGQVQSASFVTGAPSVAPPAIGAFDRLAIEDAGTVGAQNQEIYTWNADLRFVGQVFSYVGSYNSQDFASMGAQDGADYFAPPRFPLVQRQFRDPAGNEAVCAEQGVRTGTIPTNQVYFQCTHGRAMRESHEIRLASEERLAGIFDYVIGGLYDRNKTPSRLTQETPILATPTRVGLINLTPIVRDGNSTEKSGFANVTAHVGDSLELSGGLRYIEYKSFSSIVTGGTRPIPDQTEKFDATIYTASAKYRFNDDFMVYATVGSSWRPGAFAVGDFNLRPTPREQSFFDLPPETSTSYEIGLKASFFDKRGRFNLSLYRQDFDDYVYRGPSVYYVNYALQGGVVRPAVASFNFVAGVPARVEGVEAEASFQIMPRWSVAANFSYADGRIRNGLVACTDLNGDGVPDVNAPLPTLAQLQAAVGAGENVSQCEFSGRATFAPKWNANLQSEAGFTLADWSDGFVRGLLNYTPDNANDPNNSLDDVKGYALLNLYTGARDPDGSWEVSLFAKNVFNTQRILSRGGAPLSASIRTFTGSLNYVSDYYGISTLAPREFGINLRVALGSR